MTFLPLFGGSVIYYFYFILVLKPGTGAWWVCKMLILICDISNVINIELMIFDLGCM
jgi:hypothetical protein